jgi:DNA-binding protein HU-beta
MTEVLKMNKTELINTVAEKAAVSKKDAENVVTAALDAIVSAVAEEEKVQLVGFGTFECRSRSARQGRDPRTNKTIEIPASKVPAFKAGKAFKDAVNK